MTTLFNSREREKEDRIELFRHADKRFHFVDVKEAEAGTMGVIVGVWKDEEQFMRFGRFWILACHH